MMGFVRKRTVTHVSVSARPIPYSSSHRFMGFSHIRTLVHVSYSVRPIHYIVCDNFLFFSIGRRKKENWEEKQEIHFIKGSFFLHEIFMKSSYFTSQVSKVQGSEFHFISLHFDG